MIEQTLIELTTVLKDLVVSIKSLNLASPPVATDSPAPTTTTQAAPAGTAEPPKRTRRTKAEMAADAAAAATTTQAAPAPAAPAAPAELTVADVRNLQAVLMDAGHVEKVKAVNAKLGVKRAADLKPEQFAEAVKLLQALQEELKVATPAAAEEPNTEVIKAPTPEPAKVVTLDEVKALAIKLRDAGHTDKIKAVINPMGILKVTEAPADKLPAIFNGLNAAFAAIADDPAA